MRAWLFAVSSGWHIFNGLDPASQQRLVDARRHAARANLGHGQQHVFQPRWVWEQRRAAWLQPPSFARERHRAEWVRQARGVVAARAERGSGSREQKGGGGSDGEQREEEKLTEASVASVMHALRRAGVASGVGVESVGGAAAAVAAAAAAAAMAASVPVVA